MRLYVVFLWLIIGFTIGTATDGTVYYISEADDILVEVEENGFCYIYGDGESISGILESSSDDESVVQVDSEEIQNIIKDCPKELPDSSRTRFKRAEIEFLHFIYPGTKWCGAGNISSDYFDVGEFKETDKCCRTHDMCPVNIGGFSTEHGMTNFSPFTRSHCACDSAFYECLKKSNDEAGAKIGDIYFNILNVDCIDEKSDLVCLEKGEKDECRKYGIEITREFVSNKHF